MAVFSKAKTSSDIVLGIATVWQGQTAATYDNTQRTVHYASGDSLGWVQNLNTRFDHHGGVGGSGNWEH